MTQEKILYNSDEAASIKTVNGWVSSSGRFWGKDEHMARWEGCTHKICKCGNEVEKSWTICEACRIKQANEAYEAMPFKEWDGKIPLVTFRGDQYFFSEDDIEMYLDENDIQTTDLRLIICEPNYLTTVSSDIWQDIFPEDQDDLPKEVEDALNNFNAVIKKQPPFSWSEGKYRTKYNPLDSSPL